eukprot:m.267189 g.267189  ORF g.267189 m.267189 type:complete len:65 (+) comp40508_c1_seq51:1212-1406(+)
MSDRIKRGSKKSNTTLQPQVVIPALRLPVCVKIHEINTGMKTPFEVFLLGAPTDVNSRVWAQIL